MWVWYTCISNFSEWTDLQTQAAWCWEKAHQVGTSSKWLTTLITRFMGPTWGPPGAARTQVGPMLAPWILLSGYSPASFYMVKFAIYTPRFNEVERGVYWYHLVRLSVCPSVDRIVSALYLQQYSLDPFHICTSYQATSEGVSRVMPVSKLKNLKFWRIF